jgi:hypothetical protein
MITADYIPEQFTLDAMAESISAFEDLLRRKQENLPAGSSIETAGLAVLEMLEIYKGNVQSDPSQDHRKEWREAVALADMLRKVLSADGHPCFDDLWPHILLLLGQANIALNVWNPSIDADANKIFELYMALIISRLTSSLELDDPEHSSGGTNPDVIADLEGARWAFACKVMHSRSPQTFLNRVREGIEQIENSNADQGIVVISLKNLLPHDDYWTLGPVQPGLWNELMPRAIEPEIVARMFNHFCAGYHQKVIDLFPNGPEGFRNLFTNKKATPVVLLHLCSTVSASVNDKPSFHFMRMLCALTEDPLPDGVLTMLNNLNLSLHNRFTSSTTPPFKVQQ